MTETGNNAPMRYTPEVAEILGMKHKNLLLFLYRHEDLKPQKNPNNDYIWTQKDIDRLIAYRNRRKKA